MGAAYFDHNATTPLDPRVFDAMRPWLEARPGNPSSVHAFGQAAREAVEEARSEVAAAIGAGEPTQVVFTALGTEGLNAVLLGAGRDGGEKAPRHFVLTTLEHPATQAAAGALEDDGHAVTRVGPDGAGVVSGGSIEVALRPETALVCLMLANNEIGTLQPVAEVAALCRDRGVPVLCDAVQAVGKMRVDVEELGVDYLVLGAHKFYGPLGAAALWIRPGAEFRPFLIGGSQERRRRAGTENVPAIVGMGKAAELVALELDERREHMAGLRDRFEDLLGGIEDVTVHGADVPRLPNTSHVAFQGVSAQSLMIRLDLKGFAVSAGSACSSGKVEPSEALLSMGVSPEEALSSLRVSFGMTNTMDEVEAFYEVLHQEVAELRQVTRSA